MKWNIQWRVWKLKEKETKEKIKDKVKELVNTEAKALWGLFKDGFFRVELFQRVLDGKGMLED